ncbi:MAG: CHAT domain-containing protein [Desulfomonile tiedjei]|nr:CHAT domain-containing protein [Desulfomonile tiedjei]
MKVKSSITDLEPPTNQEGKTNPFCRCMFCRLPLMIAMVAVSWLYTCVTLAQPVEQESVGGSDRTATKRLAAGEADKAKKYHWLFREPSPDKSTQEPESASILQKLDREVKEARRLYLAGETDNATIKYRSAIDYLESLVDDAPPGHALLKELEQRLSLYDELATKILGPMHLEPAEDQSARIFHLMEKRRICRRNLALKKAVVLNFFDVPATLLKEEAILLKKLAELREDPLSAANRNAEEALKTKLGEVRKSLHKSSPRYAMFRKGVPMPLGDLRRDLLGKDEMILDFNMFSDRTVVGIITNEKAIYHQVPANRPEIDRTVFNLQDKLREFTSGAQSTFMGHAWKEPCRRIYRALLGKLPPLPTDKPTVFVIPDRSLWYLPFSVMLDSEDRPFGRDRLVSTIPSADMLQFVRSWNSEQGKPNSPGTLLVYESIPWIPEEEMRETASPQAPSKKKREKLSESERIERLILTNPVYPKPSEIVVRIQKMFKKFDVQAAQAATADRLMENRDAREDVALLAVPLAMTDSVEADRQPCFFFSPDKQGRRTLCANALFSTPIRSKLLIMPVSWFDVQDKDTPVGEGPLLLGTAMIYAGVRAGMVNYSDANWGSEEPFLLAVMKKLSEQVPVDKALAEYAKDMPAGLDSSFSGRPPAWAGWILTGDPR